VELQREAHKADRDNFAVEMLREKHNGEAANPAPSQSVAVSRSDKIVEKAGSSAVAKLWTGLPSWHLPGKGGEVSGRFARSGILKNSSDNLQ
jgi:hypothetical protein